MADRGKLGVKRRKIIYIKRQEFESRDNLVTS